MRVSIEKVKHFKVFVLSVVCAILAACASKSVVNTTGNDANNLVLNLFGDDPEITRGRVKAAADAVGPNGHLILDYAPKENLKKPVEDGHGLLMPIDLAVSEIPEAVKG